MKPWLDEQRCRCMAAATLAAMLLTAGAGAAGPPATGAPADPDAEPAPELAAELPQRCWGLALGLSMGSTALLSGVGFGLSMGGYEDAGLALSLLGNIVGPSVGHIYTGQYWHALGTSLGRGAATGIMLAGLMHTDFLASVFGREPDAPAWAWPVTLLGAAGVLGLTIYDYVDAPLSAVRFNERARGAQLSLAPLVLQPPAGRPEAGPALGMGLSGRF